MFKNNKVLKQSYFHDYYQTESTLNIYWDDDILVFSDIKWKQVFDRPQQILTRAATDRRVFFFEEPVYDKKTSSEFSISHSNNIIIITPYFSKSDSSEKINESRKTIIKEIIRTYNIKSFINWYYSPKALEYTIDLEPLVCIYERLHDKHIDNDEALLLENKILKRSEIVFTGSRKTYESLKNNGSNIYYFPGSIDFEHFSKRNLAEPYEQFLIPSPKIGYYGLIDECMDLEMLNDLSELRPDWSWILIGPVINISTGDLPKKDNIYYFGQKDYSDIPSYMSKWNAGMIPLKNNCNSEYYNPKKVLELLASNKPVVSTPVSEHDMLLGNEKLVRFADNTEDFIKELENSFYDVHDREWQKKRKELFSLTSWDSTWSGMELLISNNLLEKRISNIEYKIKEGIII